MDQNDLDDFKQFEENTKLEIIKLKNNSNDNRAKKMLDSLSEELERWFSEVKDFINEHKDSDKLKEKLDSIKIETSILLGKAKEKIETVKEDDKVKDFIDSATSTLESLRDSLNDSETYNKVKNNVSQTFDNIKNDENLKQGVKKVKKSTLNFAKKALSSIEKALEKEECDDDSDIIIHSVNKESDNK